MSIAETLDAFVTYCKSASGMQCYFGSRTLSSGELPCMEVRHEEVGEAIVRETNAVSVSLPLRVIISVDKNSAMLAYAKLERVIGRIGKFRQDTGVAAGISEGITPSEENGIFSLSITVTLWRIVHNIE